MNNLQKKFYDIYTGDNLGDGGNLQEQEQPKEMKLQKVDVGVWVKANELKEIEHPLCIRYDGGGAPYYETVCSMEELWKITSKYNPITEVEWLKPLKDRYILTEKELKIIWDASLNYYKSEYKMEKDTANNQMKPQPNFTQFIKSITNGK